MGSVSRWRDAGHLERAVETAGGQRAFESAVTAMLDDARGWRLAEMRKRRGMTQEQVAERMGVSVARVSQIESGDVSTQVVLSRFVAALGAPSSSSPTSATRCSSSRRWGRRCAAAQSAMRWQSLPQESEALPQSCGGSAAGCRP
jgi:transcriptional regulator with XRE-family HTH domain